jgi:hypothetical protein
VVVVVVIVGIRLRQAALVAQAVAARVAQMEMPVRREQLILAVVEAEEEVTQLWEAALPAALAS